MNRVETGDVVEVIGRQIIAPAHAGVAGEEAAVAVVVDDAGAGVGALDAADVRNIDTLVGECRGDQVAAGVGAEAAEIAGHQPQPMRQHRDIDRVTAGKLLAGIDIGVDGIVAEPEQPGTFVADRHLSSRSSTYSGAPRVAWRAGATGWR